MSQRESTRAELYTKMTIALGSFGALCGLAYIEVMYPREVPFWMFLMMLSILSTMLGVDIIQEWRHQKENGDP